MAATVDFPIAIEPVRPATIIASPFAPCAHLYIVLDKGAQFGRHFRAPTEPALESRSSLVQEHPEPLRRAQAARSRRLDQGRPERDVDDIGHDRVRRQRGEVEA